MNALAKNFAVSFNDNFLPADTEDSIVDVVNKVVSVVQESSVKEYMEANPELEAFRKHLILHGSAKGYTSSAVDYDTVIIKDLSKELGEFDYIICHGVYSWVADDVKNAMLDVCEKHLAANGLVYVSYNTYPGWHSIEKVRQLMLFANKHNPTLPQLDKVKRGKYIASLIGSQILNYDDLKQKNAKFLSVLRQALVKDDYYIGHDHLEPNNDPVYFHQFIDHVESKGLSYVCDADLTLSMVRYYDTELGQKLDVMSDNNQTDMEQYLDFIVDTPFRKSILCKSNEKANVDYTLSHSESYKDKTVQSLLDQFTYTIQLPEEALETLENPLYKDMLQTIFRDTKEFSITVAKATIKALTESNDAYKDVLKKKELNYDELYQFILTHLIRGGLDFKVRPSQNVIYEEGSVYVPSRYISFTQSVLNGSGKGIMLAGDYTNSPIGDLNEEDLQFMVFLEKPRQKSEIIDFIIKNAFPGHSAKEEVFVTMAEDYYKEVRTRIERFGFLAKK